MVMIKKPKVMPMRATAFSPMTKSRLSNTQVSCVASCAEAKSCNVHSNPYACAGGMACHGVNRLHMAKLRSALLVTANIAKFANADGAVVPQARQRAKVLEFFTE